MTSHRLLLCLLLFAAPLWASEPDRVQLLQDYTPLRSQLRIAAPEGEVAVGDIFRGLARLNGYDDSELRGALPEVKISLAHRASQWARATFNWLLQPCVRCEIEENSAATTEIQLTIEREAARNWINRRKAGVRKAFHYVDYRGNPPEYGIKFLEDPQAATSDIVVLVHGLNSRPEDLAAWVPLIREADLIPATLRYPNDQPIDQSAKLLSQELARIGGKYPERKVRLLTHSMGGLVARGSLELPRCDPGNVSQLIMVAPPNQGSALASVAMFMDCYELCTSADCRRLGALVAFVSDGLGEAAADLQPHSVFLDKINARPRHPQVDYTILLGTKAPMQAEEMSALRDHVREYTGANRYVRFVGSKLNRSLDSLNEVVDGRGDGVVATWRGRLRGVSDVVQLPFRHASILDGSLHSSQRTYAVIADRLGQQTR